MELTKSEMQIMDVFWGSGEPLSRADLLSQSQNKTWKDSSVHILLNGLLAKGAIEEAGFVKRSKTFGRTFLPTLSREEYFSQNVFSYRNKPEFVGLIRCLLQREDITKADMEQIELLVEAKKNKL